ncbi:hypothetical protein MXL46_17905 [Heyndrickxia sporothermodurans]|uniref:Uncharacterized protein n=1 Tax=Heyndrickxia sporothermodurans TaxID=46224 RepID=A0A150KVP7_9BACI|nr:hypothetical protein [Heyndrickxia sporothermodurans]KYD04118.1 hypothetical protein B4102_3316 [Heyndrickxia sporothermodurans]MBL5768123.1 hypothetical protein [Heyndrickxia sporothermodurans]MBL5771776.1 hypothetical protein [Heyndrickxia sporothermodurans]MBL5775394.1 hypothetical protein [Heyndrickxia sporothermodurans]MBL5778886.1 hypothetical protein [Heyndrickxia sporothermodurans]
MSNADLKDLQVELAQLKEKNKQLYEERVLPRLKSKVDEFLAVFEDYFRERGFVVRTSHQSVMVAYDSLEFKAFTNDGNDIFIMKDRDQIASISVKYNTPNQSASYTFDHTIDQLKWEIKKEQTLSSYLERPEFFYTGSEFGRRYEHPLTVLDSIFHI